MNFRHPVGRGVMLAVLAVVLLGVLGYLLVLALQGEHLFKVVLGPRGPVYSDHDVRLWLAVAAGAGGLMIAGWGLAERRLASLAGTAESEREARASEQEAQRQLEESEGERRRLERERNEDRARLQEATRRWRSERDWNHELREQINRLQRAHGPLGNHDDVRQTVLELTMSLVGAEKGILLSARERAGQPLKVVCHLGFEADPQDSAVAQRFATVVIERDVTIREDDEHRVDAEKRTAADEEVRNLLAIPMYLSDDFSGVIICANREDGFESLDDDVLLAVGDHAGAVLQNSRLHGDLRSAYLSTIRVLADAIELKDPELRGHSDAVSGYVLAVADRLDFEPQRRESLIFASLLHDVGKLGISERILLKPAALTDEERSVIQLHPRIGYQLIRQVPALQEIAPAVLHHHERFDGDGYPGRLRGETIPLEARIIAIADTFSAITSDRPYSRARSPAEACAELERCAGGQFDPEVVRLFVEAVRSRPAAPREAAARSTDPELDVHRADGDFKLGALSFGITDSLTLLYSHRHFHETARSYAQRAELQALPFAIVILELTDLWEINRRQGFAEGDAALQSVASLAQRAAGRCRGLAFRASGSRIALLLPGLDQTAADQQARGIAVELGSEPAVRVTVAAWQTGDDGERVIERALGAAQPSSPRVAAIDPSGLDHERFTRAMSRPWADRWAEYLRRRRP